LPDRAALARLCRTLWVRSSDEKRLFDYYFEQLIGQEQPSLISLSEEEAADEPQPNSQHFLRTAALSGLLAALILGTGIAIVLLMRPGQQNKGASTPQPSVTTTLVPGQPSPTATASPAPTKQPPQSQPWFPWLLGLLITLAVGAGCFWLVKVLLQRKKPPLHPPPLSPLHPEAIIAPELLPDIQDEIQVAHAVREVTRQEDETSSSRFLLATEYLPVTQRQMKQCWRHLRRLVREGLPTELDIDATVQQIGREGMLLHPVLVPRRINRMELILLIDQEGSMVPFHGLSARLMETAMRGGRLGRAGVYYFHNSPVDHLYRDPFHQEAVAIADLLPQFHKHRTVVLIFSDAGAARGGLSMERLDLTARFLRQLQQQVRRVVWLNPMPRSRWAGTTAEKIARSIPMFEVTRQGLDSAIDILRGRVSHIQLRE
jgi:uncharacterized protein with von Willebrand factor type A (vWA) domain